MNFVDHRDHRHIAECEDDWTFESSERTICKEAENTVLKDMCQLSYGGVVEVERICVGIWEEELKKRANKP